MTYAPTYNRLYNFSNFQAVNPTTPLPANQVDAELNQIKITLDAILQNLALIQRSDGAIANQSVGSSQLASNLAVGFTMRGPWVSTNTYAPGDAVTVGSQFWLCLIAPTSATVPTSDTAHWLFCFDFAAYGISAALTSYLTALPTYTGSGAAPVATGNLFWNNGILEKAQ